MKPPNAKPRQWPSAAGASRGTGSNARRLPDLHVLPPLLHSSGAFGALRARLGMEKSEKRRCRPGGRHAALASVPHGAKTFLAAALVLGDEPGPGPGDGRRSPPSPAHRRTVSSGSPATPRSAIAWRRNCRPGSATPTRWPFSSRGPHSPTSAASWYATRPRPASRLWPHGGAAAPAFSWPACRRLLQHTLDPSEVPAAPRRLKVGARIHQDELLHELLALGYDPVLEVAGRGEFARRGGLVDVFPSAAPLPIRIELFGDEIDSMRVFDPADQRSIRPVDELVLLPASEFLVPHGGIAEIRSRLSAGGFSGAKAAAAAAGGARPGFRTAWPRISPDSRRGSTSARARSGRDRPRTRRGCGRARTRDRRRRRGLGRAPVPRDRTRSHPAGDAPGDRRAGRRGRCRGLPVAPGRGAASGADGRAAICLRTGRRHTCRPATGRRGCCAAGPWS